MTTGLRQFNGCPCIDPRGPLPEPTPFAERPQIRPSGPFQGEQSFGRPNFGDPNFERPNSSGRPPNGIGGGPFPMGGPTPEISIRPARFEASADLFPRLSRAVFSSSKQKE